jgi:hypothetical protein
MTDARLSRELAQTAIQMDSSTVAARNSRNGAHAAFEIDTATIVGRNLRTLVQVAVQVKYGYVTDFEGRPVMCWSGGQLRHLRVMY